MTLLVNSSLIGLEEIERAIYAQLFQSVNTTLAEIEAYGNEQDALLADHLGIEQVVTALEEIEPQNFYSGHHPSLINAPIERYPNCAVMVSTVTPGLGAESFDQSEVFRNNVFIDVMVKSIVDEGEVNRRIKRTVEAVNTCVLRDQTFGGIVASGLEGSPSISIGDVFTRKAETSYGPKWFWQGARLEYAVRKEASMPSSTGSFFRTATEPPPWAGADIDQP